MLTRPTVFFVFVATLFLVSCSGQSSLRDELNPSLRPPQPAQLPSLPTFEENTNADEDLQETQGSSNCPCKPITSNLRGNSMALLEMGIGVDCKGFFCKMLKKAKNVVTDVAKDVVKDVKGKVKEKIKEVKGKVKEKIKEVKGKVKEKIKDAVDHVGDSLTGQRTGKDKDLKGPPVSPSDVDVDMVSFTAFAAVHTYTKEDGTIPSDYPMQQVGETINVPYNSVSSKFIKAFTSETPGAVAKVYKTKDGTCIVGYRGTTLNSDWLVNLKVGKIGKKFMKGVKSGKGQCVHAGFYEHMKLSKPRVAKILAENDCKPETTVLTGHSLGGATATLAAVEGLGKRLYTYGAPRSLCKSCPSELQDVDSHRFVAAYIAKHTNNKRDYTEIYDMVPQGKYLLNYM